MGQARVALYARVSTMNGQDPEVQTRELRDYCRQRGWKIVGEYVDRGISGAKDSRPQLDVLMEHAHRRKFDAVAVWKFDRFARSVSHLIRALETFRTLGIEFVSLTEAVDTATPTGKMVYTVLGAVGELERDLIRERVRAGMRNAKANGKRIGRPRTKDLSMQELQQVRQLRRNEKVSVRSLALRFGVTQFLINKALEQASGALKNSSF